jgi:hypothetical protein
MGFNKKSLPPVHELIDIVKKNPDYIKSIMQADMVMGSTESMKFYEEQVALHQLKKNDIEESEMTSHKDSF